MTSYHPDVYRYAPWSISRAGTANRCPLAFKFNYVDKLERGRSGSAALIGVVAHEALEFALKGMDVQTAVKKAIDNSREPLLQSEEDTVLSFTSNIADFVERMDVFKEKYDVVQTFYEEPWAIDAQYQPVDFDSDDALIRGVVDFGMLTKSGHLIIIDHKSGKKNAISYYATQLDVYKIFGLANIPGIKGIQCAIHYVRTGDLVWESPVSAKHVTRILKPWLPSYLNQTVSKLEDFAPRKTRLCSWCDFKDHCPEFSDGEEVLNL